MTDNEIMQALECAEGIDIPCLECSYKTVAPFPECRLKCVKDALDLINRQKSEIERLKKENAKQKVMLGYIEDEMFPLPFETDFDKAIKQAKSEAIKEFAEMLKKRLCLNLGEQISVVTRDDIDRFVKEMTEQING